MPSGWRIKRTLKRCNLHLHNGGALVNVNGLSSLMRLLDKDQNKLFSFFLPIKTQTSHTRRSFVTSFILMFIKRANCKDKLLRVQAATTAIQTGAADSVFVFFPPSLPAASFQLHVAGCPLNGSWHMWPKCKSDSDFPFKWAPRGICTRPPL